MTNGAWQRTSPLGVLFFFGHAIRRATGGIAQMAASLGGFAVVLQTGGLWWGLLALGSFLALLSLIAITRYWFFRFAVDDDGVRIRRGVLKKSRLDIQFDRVQGLDVEEPIIYRLFGLATVTFDTAGSAVREGQLPAITRTFARALKERVERHRPHASAPVADTAPGDVRLLKLDAGDMLRIGFTDRTILASVAAIAVVFQAGNPTRLAAWRAVDAAGDQLLALGLWIGLLVVTALLIATAAALIALTVISAFLRFHDFELLHDGTTFRSRAGLLTRKEVVLHRDKVQQFSVSQSVIMRWMGRCRFKLLPATSGVASGNSTPVNAQMLNVPLSALPLLADVRKHLFGAEGSRLAMHPDAAFTPVSPLYIRARVIVVGIVPAVVAAAVLIPMYGLPGLVVLPWIALVRLVAWQAWLRRGYLFDDDGLVSRRGLLGCSIDAFLFRKAQGATVRRTPLQRRNGLASLVVHLASGDVTVPFIDYATACRLRDYLLFKAEASRLPWH